MSGFQRPKTAEITQSGLGRDVTELFAMGMLEYMTQNGIPVTDEGFERVVQISRDTKLNGRIAFQSFTWTQQRLQQLFSQVSGIPAMPADAKRTKRLIKKKSIRNRMLDMLSGTEADSGRYLDSLSERLGGDAQLVLEALRKGDCQRDIVWKRMQEIVRDEDVKTAITSYRQRYQLIDEATAASGEVKIGGGEDPPTD
jgi:hypothetical protein